MADHAQYAPLIMANTLLFIWMHTLASASTVYVSMDDNAVFQNGDKGILPCRVDRAVGLVTWSQGYTPPKADILLRYKLSPNGWIKEGKGFINGMYDIDANFSLTLNNVRISDDDGYFFCEILDLDTGQNFWNSTDVMVYAMPTSPFPVIEECPQKNADGHICTLQGGLSNVTCSVAGYYPKISIFFIHDSKVIESTLVYESNNTDGTRNKSVTITAMASTSPYTCVVALYLRSRRNMTHRYASIIITGIPVPSTTSQTDSNASYIKPTDTNSNGDIIRIIVPVLVLSILALISGLAFVLLRRKKSTQEAPGHAQFKDEEVCLMGRGSSQNPNVASAVITAISEALKAHYSQVFCETKTSPLDPKSVKKLEQIYVNLSLLTGDRNTKQHDITYEDVIEMLRNEQNIARLAFIGEAGVGKTTLLSKIAYEWALGKLLDEIDVLLYVPLREFKTGTQIRDIIDRYIARGIGMDNQTVEDFMRATQRKIMFLLDGLDEYVGDITDAEHADTLVGIMRGDEFKRSPVIVTTRPWRVEQISTTPTLNLRYSLVKVNGFKKDNVVNYVNKFFTNDVQSAKSLIELMTGESLVAQHMAPYPIFCCMFCNMWKEESKRDTVKALDTFSDLFAEMMNSLMEHWVTKTYSWDSRKRYTKSLEQIGAIALDGLLNDKLTFLEQAFEHCTDSLKTACDIGVLSLEQRFNPAQTDAEGAQVHYSFPHKLFQEYLGGMYLSRLFIVDQTHFWTLVKDNVINDYKRFRYLIYFTVAHGKELGYAGKPLMEYLCKEISEEAFVVDVAFECYDEPGICPIIEYFQKDCTHLLLSTDFQILQSHTWSGYMHLLGLCGQKMMTTYNNLKGIGHVKKQDQKIHDSAVGLFTLPKLQSLELEFVRLNEAFYGGMAAAAPYAQIIKLYFNCIQLDQSESKHCARGIFTMESLRLLELKKMKLEDKFFLEMEKAATKSQIEELIVRDTDLSSNASHCCSKAVLTMAKLRSLEFENVKLDSQFFAVFIDIKHDSKITNLTLDNMHVSPAASQLFGNGLSTLKKLHSLKLHNVRLDNIFFSSLAVSAAASQIKVLDITGLKLNTRALASFLSLPLLQSFHLKDVRQDDYGSITLEIEKGKYANISTLEVDDMSLPILHDMGLADVCPNITHFSLEFGREVNFNIFAMASSMFPRVSHLGIMGPREYWVSVGNALEFCTKLATSYPRLTNLSLTDIELGNKTAEEIVGYLRHQDDMKSLVITRCHTDNDLDPLVTAINQEGGLHLSVELE